MRTDWYKQVRAVICSRFPAYRFEDVDRLDLDELMELYASALWLAEQESKASGRT